MEEQGRGGRQEDERKGIIRRSGEMREMEKGKSQKGEGRGRMGKRKP